MLSAVGLKVICKKALIFVMVGIRHIMEALSSVTERCCERPLSSSGEITTIVVDKDE